MRELRSTLEPPAHGGGEVSRLVHTCAQVDRLTEELKNKEEEIRRNVRSEQMMMHQMQRGGFMAGGAAQQAL